MSTKKTDLEGDVLEKITPKLYRDFHPIFKGNKPEEKKQEQALEENKFSNVGFGCDPNDDCPDADNTDKTESGLYFPEPGK